MRFVHGAAVILLTLAGCGRPSPQQQYATKIIEQYGGLQGLEATSDPELRAEYARLVAEKATPRALVRPAAPVEQNAAPALAALVPPEKVAKLLEETGPLAEADRLLQGPVELERAEELVRRHEATLAAWRAAWQMPDCTFDIPATAGYFADLRFLPQVRCGARLELLAGAAAASRGNPDDAVAAVRTLLRACAALSATDHLVCALEAARLRGEALRLVELVAQHRATTAAQHRALAELLTAHLAGWPAEARVWSADRALGMHAYETIRGGDLAALLTDTDIARLAEQRELEHFSAAVERNLDRDELYYLKTMRTFIAACDRPYEARREILRDLNARLARLEGTVDYPLVAGRLLLPGLDRAARAMAADRAACEAWRAALAAATGDTSQPPINPLSGDPLVVEITARQITIPATGRTDDPWPRPLIVPQRTNTLARKPNKN